MKTFIAPTVDTEVKDVFVAVDKHISIAVDGLTSIEAVSILLDYDGKWKSPVPAIELTAQSTYLQLSGPNTYRINKPATANPVGVYITR